MPTFRYVCTSVRTSTMRNIDRMSGIAYHHTVNDAKNSSHCGDGKHPQGKFAVPSPIPTRKNRTFSLSEMAAQGATYGGKVKEFCRNRGHGFIIADETKECLFVHISDIEGEFVPREGDDVTFKLCPLPFNSTKKQAVHVHITHLAPGVSHETWNAQTAPYSPVHMLPPS